MAFTLWRGGRVVARAPDLECLLFHEKERLHIASKETRHSKDDKGTQPALESKASTATGSVSTRDQLVETGLDLMRRHGYGGAGLQEILQSAGVPKGSFYHHFGSKEGFTVAVIERYFMLESQHCREVLTNSRQAPLKRLRRYFEDLIRSAGQRATIQGCLLGKLSLEVAGTSALLQGSLSESFAGWQGAVAMVLREAVERGDLAKSTRPEALAGFVLNSWEGALLRSEADKSDAPLKEFLRYVFDELLVS
jgi:TetR/AcrR family transcriptional repressor of nem operon